MNIYLQHFQLPWFMQYLVEKYGIEDAVQEQVNLLICVIALYLMMIL